MPALWKEIFLCKEIDRKSENGIHLNWVRYVYPDWYSYIFETERHSYSVSAYYLIGTNNNQSRHVKQIDRHENYGVCRVLILDRMIENM